MDKSVPSTPLEHASVGALKNYILDNTKSVDELSSTDIVRMCFGIQNAKPAQVEIMSNVINSVGGRRAELVTALRDKFASGTLWEFTTNFGINVTLAKIQHKDGINPLRLSLTQKISDTKTEHRPLVEFTGGQCEFFGIDAKEIIEAETAHEKFSFTTDTVKKEEHEPISETIQPEVPPEPTPEPEPATEAIQDEPVVEEEAGEDSEAEGGGLTAVEELGEKPAYLPVDTNILVDGIQRVRTMNKIHEAVSKIIATGSATMELIEELIRPNVPKYNLEFELKDGSVRIMLSEKTVEPPAPEPTLPEPEPTPDPAQLEAERRIKEDLDILLHAEKTLCEEFEKRNAYDQVKLLQEFQEKIKSINPVVRKDIFSKNYPDVANSLAARFRELTIRAQENYEAKVASDKAKLDEAIAEEQEGMTDTTEEVVTEPTEEVIEQTPDTTSEVDKEVVEETQLQEEPPQEEKKEMIVRIDCPAAIPDEDYKKIQAKIAELNVSDGNALTDAEKSKLITADIGYECTLVTVKDSEEYVVTIPIEEDNGDEKSEEEELQEAMMEDKAPEVQWLDLSDAAVREPFMQVLFPGISYPSYMHLMTFLKKFHTEEQTKTFIATKGSIPAETTIVYDNVTFCIVKMKESRFYRIFIANTDYSLKEHGWCETNFIPNRWFRLGQDIHNPCFQNEGIIENRGGYHRGFGR